MRTRPKRFRALATGTFVALWMLVALPGCDSKGTSSAGLQRAALCLARRWG
jgi:hypothetical protein